MRFADEGNIVLIKPHFRISLLLSAGCFGDCLTLALSRLVED